MTDPHAALTALITEHSGLTGPRAGRLADKIAAEWPPAQAVVDREALAKALHDYHRAYQAQRTCDWCQMHADDIIAAGVVADAADVRRQTADDIAAAIEARVEESRQRGEQADQRQDARIGEAIIRAGLQDAARLAREVGGDRG